MTGDGATVNEYSIQDELGEIDRRTLVFSIRTGYNFYDSLYGTGFGVVSMRIQTFHRAVC